uniref:Lactosylceramide alpha-2,3-sialyltransferase n=1 Tax=Sinocyclocheilus grahami TaxID=75366 RepID=A0A672K2J2_SINGR
SFPTYKLRYSLGPSLVQTRVGSKPDYSTPVLEPFLDKNTHFNEQIFQYSPPFGFLDMKNKLQEILDHLPASSEERRGGRDCRRCLVIGNGGILKGLGTCARVFMGLLFVCRLNSGPVRGFSADVGNRTSIRMSYPEGSPKVWEDTDSDIRFVAVIYKSVDFHWLRAMITKTSSLWDWLFFWQNVPVSVPLKASQFRLLNPEIIRETALDLLHYPNVRERLWGWDQVSCLAVDLTWCDYVKK